jgi:hypothetical protein
MLSPIVTPKQDSQSNFNFQMSPKTTLSPREFRIKSLNSLNANSPLYKRAPSG